MRCHVGETTACLLADCPEFSITARGQLDIKGKGCVKCVEQHMCNRSLKIPSLKAAGACRNICVLIQRNAQRCAAAPWLSDSRVRL